MTPRAERPPYRAVAAAAALALLVAGCGESRYGSSSTNTSAAPTPTKSSAGGARPTVVEHQYSLSPSTLKIAKPSRIGLSIKNGGTIDHALEVRSSRGEVRTAAITPGGTAKLEVVLPKPGRYEWYCPIDGHRARGMRGTIVVAGGKASGAGEPKHRAKHHNRSGSGGANPSGGGSGGGGYYPG